MNQTMTIREKEYTISSVDGTGTKFILVSQTGEQVALGIDVALLDVYTKQVMADFDRFMNVGELENTIRQVERYLSSNGAYQRMKELVPNITLPQELFMKRAEEFKNFYVQKYPDRVSMVEVPQPEVISVEQEQMVNNVQESVPVVEVPNENNMNVETRNYIPIRNINVMEVTHDQKSILLFLNGKYEGYEISEDFTHARDPRTGTTYVLSMNENGQVQMIDTNRNVTRELERTAPLTDTRKIFINGLDVEELNNLINTSPNVAEVQYATALKNGLKEEFGVDDTMLIEPAKIKQKVMADRMGFISHLTISFLVGILGGIVLMILGNSISVLF